VKKEKVIALMLAGTIFSSGCTFKLVNDNKKDNNDLEDWQKELVKENKHDSFNFEEEELEDDDYYSEDDDE